MRRRLCACRRLSRRGAQRHCASARMAAPRTEPPHACLHDESIACAAGTGRIRPHSLALLTTDVRVRFAIRRPVPAIDGGGEARNPARDRPRPLTTRPAAPWVGHWTRRLANRSSRLTPQPAIRAADSSRTPPLGAPLPASGWRRRQTACDRLSDAGGYGTSRAGAAAPARLVASRHAAGRCFRSPGGRARTGGRPLTCARPPSLVRPSSRSPSCDGLVRRRFWSRLRFRGPAWPAASPPPSVAWRASRFWRRALAVRASFQPS